MPKGAPVTEGTFDVRCSTQISHIVLALALSVIAIAPVLAQVQKTAAVSTNGIPAAERKAMATCVGNVLDRLQQERASYQAVKPAVAKECDTQLRAVLAAAIRVGQAGPCTSVEGCIDLARGRAGDEAALEFQQAAFRR